MKKWTRVLVLLLVALQIAVFPLSSLATEGDAHLTSNREVSFQTDDDVSLLAAELTKDKHTTEEKAMAIYNYIVSNFSYDWKLYEQVVSKQITRYTPDPNTALQAQKGICYDITSLYAAMCRSVGIPTKLVKGYVSTTKYYHAWNSVYDDAKGEWIAMDLTTDILLGKSASASWRKLKKKVVAVKEA